MIKRIPQNIIRFILVVVLQVFVFNYVRIGGYINPQFYVLFILLLPYETPKWVLLTMALVLGLTIDVFTFTYGFHALATVVMAFVRPAVLDTFSPHDGYESGTYPRIYYYGFVWFLKYALILVVIHHSVLFFAEYFKFVEFFRTLLKVILSTIFTVTFIVISQYLVFRR